MGSIISHGFYLTHKNTTGGTDPFMNEKTQEEKLFDFEESAQIWAGIHISGQSTHTVFSKMVGLNDNCGPEICTLRMAFRYLSLSLSSLSLSLHLPLSSPSLTLLLPLSLPFPPSLSHIFLYFMVKSLRNNFKNTSTILQRKEILYLNL